MLGGTDVNGQDSLRNLLTLVAIVLHVYVQRGVFVSPAWAACDSHLIDTRWESRLNECTRPSEDVGHALIPLRRSHSHKGKNAADVDAVTASPETGLV